MQGETKGEDRRKDEAEEEKKVKEEEERARGKRTSPGQAPWGKEHAWGGISTSMGVEMWQWLITHAASRIYRLRIVRLGIVLDPTGDKKRDEKSANKKCSNGGC